jgi:outer membrane protein TolC
LAEEFNLQADFVESAREAKNIAQIVYETNKKRFLNGEIDIHTLNITLERRDSAELSYVDALYNYWLIYYKIRKLTLFDFEKNESLIESTKYMLSGYNITF